MKKIHRKKNNKKEAAFSLLELLVTVAIILILSALLVPKLLASRGAAVQAAAGSTARQMGTALSQYQLTYGVFPATVSLLGGDCTAAAQSPSNACLLDNSIASILGTATYQHYNWTYSAGTNGSSFTLVGVPDGTSNYITRSFFQSDGLVIHYSDSGAATLTSPVLANSN